MDSRVDGGRGWNHTLLPPRNNPVVLTAAQQRMRPFLLGFPQVQGEEETALRSGPFCHHSNFNWMVKWGVGG